MKIALIIVTFVLLVASLIGIYQAYGLPTEKPVTEEVTLLDYQHQGKFDYLVYLNPSHLYGPGPQETPPPPDLIKYPAGFIDRFDMVFSYRFVPDRPVSGTSEEVEVRAMVRSPGTSEPKEIILVPRTSETGDFTVSFSLNISDNISDDYITIGDNISGSEITITADVYAVVATETGPVFESFTQSLPLRVRGPLIEVDGDLDQDNPGYVGELNYVQQGEFVYEVYLKPDSPFGAITLKPPSIISPTPAPPEILGPEDTIIYRLIDAMDVSFSYHLESSQPIKTLDETVAIEAILESPEQWSKTIELVPPTDKSGDFTVTFPLDLEHFSELFNIIQQETGTSASARNLTIRAEVHALADTDSGTIDADFTPSITADLAGDTLVWSENLTQSEPGSIKTTRVVPQTEKYLWMPVSRARILLPVVASIILVLFIFALLWYFWQRPGKFTAAEKEARQAQKKYKNIIVEIKELPEVKPGETVILLNSLDDLVRTGEGLLKPVLHKAEGRRHVYCVFDATTRYEYHLS
jgi:hypothetical protein